MKAVHSMNEYYQLIGKGSTRVEDEKKEKSRKKKGVEKSYYDLGVHIVETSNKTEKRPT
jgi:hypothetical protein